MMEPYVVPMAILVPRVRPLMSSAQMTLGKRRSSAVCYVFVSVKALSKRQELAYPQHVPGCGPVRTSNPQTQIRLPCPWLIVDIVQRRSSCANWYFLFDRRTLGVVSS